MLFFPRARHLSLYYVFLSSINACHGGYVAECAIFALCYVFYTGLKQKYVLPEHFSVIRQPLSAVNNQQPPTALVDGQPAPH